MATKTTMRIAGVNPNALTDGPGKRFSVYVQGCSIRCPGCHVTHLHDPRAGYAVDVRQLANEALASGLPVSILGAEPTEQPLALAVLVKRLKAAKNPPHVIVYSGRTFDDLVFSTPRPLSEWVAIMDVLSHADVLVDGPFIADLDSDRMQYRGSANQRVIDLPATMQMPMPALRERGPVLIDWDTPELILTPDGDVLAAEGLAADFAALGERVPARRCGEVKRLSPQELDAIQSRESGASVGAQTDVPALLAHVHALECERVELLAQLAAARQASARVCAALRALMPLVEDEATYTAYRGEFDAAAEALLLEAPPG